jgi:PAS domain S-box-containing protein
MSLKGAPDREFRNLSFIIIISIIFSLLSLSIDFIDKVREFFPDYEIVPINDFLINCVFFCLVVILGITYKRWKKALIKKKELEDIFYSINRDALVVVDTSGKILMCNNAVEGLFGYTVAEVVNQSIGLIYEENDTEDANYKAEREHRNSENLPVNFGTGKSKDGVRIPLEVARYNRVNEGGAVLLLRDITERRKVEERLEDYRCHLEDLVDERTVALEKVNRALKKEVKERAQTAQLLREKEERLRVLVQSASDGIIAIDSNQRVISWNGGAEVIFGHSAQDIIGKPFSHLFPECFREQNKQLIEGMNSTVNTTYIGKTFEYPGRRIDGSEFPAEISYARWESKEEVFITAIVRDITERRKAQIRMKETRDFLEDIFKTTADGIIVTSVPDGEITMINEALEKILGYSREEMLGRNVSEFFWKDEKKQTNGTGYITHLMKDHVLEAKEQLWKRKDGTVVNIECNAALLKDREGNNKGSVATLRDITQRKSDEINLKETKDHLDNLIESSLDGIIVSDSMGTLTRANKSFLELIGYSEQEVTGKHVTEISIKEGGVYKTSSGETIEIGEDFFNDAMEMSAKLWEEGQLTHWESYFLRKDRTIVPVEMKIARLSNEKGNDIGSVGIIRDITERRKAEKELKEAKEFLEYVIRSSRDGILITDEQGTILSINGAIETISGYSKEELVGEHASLFSPDDEEMVEMILENTAKMYENGFAFYESELKKKDGTLINVECSNSMIRDDDGVDVGAVSIVRDITERKIIEGKLIQSEKLKSLGELAGGVAHDFNNVLAAILGRVQLLKLHFQSPPGGRDKRKSTMELMKGLEIIEKASLDGAETVRRVQEFSRRRVDDKDFVQIEVGKLLEDALEFTSVRWKDEAESKGTKITIKKDLKPLPITFGSASELREVFTNLIHNGLDAMPQGGTITIKTYSEDSTIVIHIEDTGIGIPEEIQKRIFDPFFTTKGVQSTGLGMSISYGIISRHKGTIEVESAEGTGTTFTIKLPVPTTDLIKESKSEATLQTNKKNASILVIEDEEEVRNLLSDILTEGGHQVITACDGKQGIDVFKENEVDMVFSDLGMPGISGWQVAETIKSINKQIPVAIITGWNVDLEQKELTEKGVDFIAFKPFAVEKVLKLVEDGIEFKKKFLAA